MPESVNVQKALENLLVDCGGVSKGTKVLFVNETGTIAIDRATVERIEGAARDLGAEVKSIWMGPVPGPESIPDNVIDAIAEAQVSIFNHSMGSMMRLRPFPGNGVGILNYATRPELLGSEWTLVPYGMWRKIARAVAGELKQGRTWRITCAEGTDLQGSVPEREWAPQSGLPSGFSLQTFPIGTHQPTSAETANGTLALRWLVSSANHDVGDGIRLDAPIVATVENGRMVGFKGADADVKAAKSYFEEIGTRYGKDPYVINSWHAGTNPQAFTPARDVENLNWWQLLIHNNPRSLHFHAIGEDVPGELSLPVLDPVIEINGEVVWDRGRFHLLDRPSVREAMKEWPADSEVFTLNHAIGL